MQVRYCPTLPTDLLAKRQTWEQLSGVNLCRTTGHAIMRGPSDLVLKRRGWKFAFGLLQLSRPDAQRGLGAVQIARHGFQGFFGVGQAADFGPVMTAQLY